MRDDLKAKDCVIEHLYYVSYSIISSLQVETSHLLPVYTAHNWSILEIIMQKIMSWNRLILIVSLVSVLTACGLKGDLYMPEDQALTSSGS